jgi:mxaK protein
MNAGIKVTRTNLVRANAAFKRVMSALRLPPVPTFLLAALALGIVYELFTIYTISEYNRYIEDPSRLQSTQDHPPQLIFAKAHYVDAQGQYREALSLYNSIEYHDAPTLRERVKYNMGTIYLQEAVKLWNAEGVEAYARVNTLLELAEAAYREVLRLNDQNWDARYNLEYAMRIRPPAKTVGKADWKAKKRSIYAVFPGIPGGGP